MRTASFVFMLLALSVCLGASVFATTDMFDNLNGNGYFIFNMSSIQGTVGHMNLSWGNLTDFPVACPPGSFISGLGYSVTCTAEGTASFNATYDAYPANWTSSFVPYVGANQNVNLGNMNLTTTGINISNYISGSGNITAKLGTYAFGYILPPTVFNATASIRALGLGSFAHGYITNLEPNSSASLTASGQGSFAQGSISVNDNYGDNAYLTATNTGAFAQGQVGSANQFGSNKNNTIFITAQGLGAFAQGSAVDTKSLNSTTFISATAQGSFAQGAAITQTRSNARNGITATNTGAFAQGSIFSGVGSGNITASGQGSFAQGFAVGTLEATGDGAFAHGYITNSKGDYIIASGTGSVAIGLANMSVSGTGSVGMGRNVNVTGSNTFAFGTSNTLENIPASSTFWVGANLNSTGNFSAQGIPGVSTSINCGSYPNVTITGGIITSWAC